MSMNLSKNWFKKVEARYDDESKAWEFDQRVGGMLDMMDELLDERFGDDGQPFGAWQKPEITLKFGSKYCKILHANRGMKAGEYTGRHVIGFLDLDGNVLLAASYNAPCLNGARSNIFDEDFGKTGFNSGGRVRYKS